MKYLFLSLLLVSASAQAQVGPFSVQTVQANATGMGLQPAAYLPIPGGHAAIVAVDGTSPTKQTVIWEPSTQFVFTRTGLPAGRSGTLHIELVAADVTDFSTAVDTHLSPTFLAIDGRLDGLEAIFSGTTSQYIRGDGSLATFPAIPSAVSQLTNDSGFVTQAGARSSVSLTTTGTSGAATYNSSTGVLNVPNYATPAALSFSYPTRSLNTAFQPSSTRNVLASYTVDITAAMSLTGGQIGIVVLEIADDSAFTTNVQTVQSSTNGNTGALIVGITLSQVATASVNGVIPAGKYARLRTVNSSGTPTFTFRAAQEVSL